MVRNVTSFESSGRSTGSNNTVEIFPLLNQFLGAMIKPVIDNKGIVDKIIGDAVMAVFGLGSDEGDDHKVRAITTGIEMIKRISDITSGTGDEASVLGLGVGVASGDVLFPGTATQVISYSKVAPVATIFLKA